MRLRTNNSDGIALTWFLRLKLFIVPDHNQVRHNESTMKSNWFALYTLNDHNVRKLVVWHLVKTRVTQFYVYLFMFLLFWNSFKNVALILVIYDYSRCSDSVNVAFVSRSLKVPLQRIFNTIIKTIS